MIKTTASGVPAEQGDLFEERGTWCEPAHSQQDIGDENFDDLSDKDLVEKTAKAKLSNVDLLCAKIVERGLGDIAVPGLVTLWNRFKGYGIATPLPEQLLALETLGAIGSGAAKTEINKILATHGLPDSLLPFVLLAAVKVGLNLPQKQILPWLEHDAPIVRAQAFALMQSSNPQRTILEIGFSDPDPAVRRAALTTAGTWAMSVQSQDCLPSSGKIQPAKQLKRFCRWRMTISSSKLGDTHWQIKNTRLSSLKSLRLWVQPRQPCWPSASRIRSQSADVCFTPDTPTASVGL